MLGEVLSSTDNSLACEPFLSTVPQDPHGLPPLLLTERGGELFLHCQVSKGASIQLSSLT